MLGSHTSVGWRKDYKRMTTIGDNIIEFPNGRTKEKELMESVSTMIEQQIQILEEQKIEIREQRKLLEEVLRKNRFKIVPIAP